MSINDCDYGKITKKFKGEGILKNSSGENFKCSFVAQQFSNGNIFVECDIKESNGAAFFKEAFIFFSGIDILEGKTNSQNKIIINGLSLLNSSSQKITFRAKNIKVYYTKNIDKADISKLKYGIVNFEFSRSEMVFEICDKKIYLKPAQKYQSLIRKIKNIRSIDLTCYVEADVNKNSIEKTNDLIKKLCIFLTLANGNYVNYLFYEIYQEDTKLKAVYRNANTKQFINLNLIPKKENTYIEDYINNKFSYFLDALRNWKINAGQETLLSLRNAILLFTDAKTSQDFLEARGLKLATAFEIIRDIYAKKYDKENIISENEFAIQSEFHELLNEKFRKEDNVTERDINRIACNIDCTNRYSFYTIIRNIYQELGMKFDENKARSFVDIRNKLVHEGSYLSDSTNFETSFEQYSFMLTFVGEVFLTIINYRGKYIDPQKYPGFEEDVSVQINEILES